MRVRWIATVVPGAVAALAFATYSQQQMVAVAQSLTAAQPACAGSLAGWDFPEVIPEYWVWERFFEEIAQPGSSVLRDANLVPGEAAVLMEAAAEGIANARLARGAAPAFAQAEAEAAEAIISARDDLTRQLPESSLRTALSRMYDRASQRQYQLPVPGKRTEVAGTARCIVSVRGKEYPHLIPETEAWRLYLLTYADVAEHTSTGPGEYNGADLRAIQTSRLPLADDDLRYFLTLAREQGVLIEHLQESGAGDRAIAQAVRAARDRLLRTVQPDVWMKLRRDAERTRYGVVFSFPPSALAEVSP